MSQTNESATVPKTFHFSELNKALTEDEVTRKKEDEVDNLLEQRSYILELFFRNLP